jgi:hypothetical protein
MGTGEWMVSSQPPVVPADTAEAPGMLHPHDAPAAPP